MNQTFGGAAAGIAAKLAEITRVIEESGGALDFQAASSLDSSQRADFLSTNSPAARGEIIREAQERGAAHDEFVFGVSG